MYIIIIVIIIIIIIIIVIIVVIVVAIVFSSAILDVHLVLRPSIQQSGRPSIHPAVSSNGTQLVKASKRVSKTKQNSQWVTVGLSSRAAPMPVGPEGIGCGAHRKSRGAG